MRFIVGFVLHMQNIYGTDLTLCLLLECYKNFIHLNEQPTPASACTAVAKIKHRGCADENSIPWLCWLVTTVQALGLNEATSTRWLRLYPGYFGFTSFAMGGSRDASSTSFTVCGYNSYLNVVM